MLTSALGCDELSARSKIQEAGKLYQKGKFEKACPLYDKVLDISDAPAVREVAYYNGGICYHKMFRPGRDTPENMHVAKRATFHFGKYLERHPEDRTIVGLMSQIWMDSGDHQSAINYWEREHAKNRKDTEVISILAGIYRQTGDWQTAVEWYYKEADVHESPAAKTGAFLKVANLMANKLLRRDEIFWEERLKYADLGLTAAQKAEALSPDNLDVQQSLGALWRFRGEAHQAVWAQLIDRANARYHYRIAGRLYREQQAKEAAAAGVPAPETPPGPDGAKTDGAKTDGAKTDGAKTDGAKTDGAKTDGAQPDGAKPDGAQPDGTQPDGAKPAATPPAGGATPPAPAAAPAQPAPAPAPGANPSPKQ